MISLLQDPIGRLRVVGLVEGSSFLLLLAVAMPLKYLAGRPEAVEVVGMAHGLLWILYLLVLAPAWMAARWGVGNGLLAFGASVVPFGPVLIDAHLRREQERLVTGAAG